MTELPVATQALWSYWQRVEYSFDSKFCLI